LVILARPGQNRQLDNIFGEKVLEKLLKTYAKSVTHAKCQRKLLNSMAESVPWETLCVDMIGPYKIKRKGKKQTWLTRYPKPDKLIYDQGSEFKAEFTDMIAGPSSIPLLKRKGKKPLILWCCNTLI
jgi:hypothetical protein